MAWTADHLRRALTGLALSWALGWGAPQALAQDIAALNAQALSAYGAGDLAAATRLTKRAVAQDPAAHDAAAYLEALNNLVFLYRQVDPLPGAARDVQSRAEQFAHDRALTDGPLWFNTLDNAIDLGLRGGDAEVARAAVRDLLDAYRGTDLHGPALTRATDALFTLADHTALPAMVAEMIAVTGGYGATTTLDQLYARQLTLEDASDLDGVAALIDTRIAIVEVVAPHLAEDFAHTMLWRKFFMAHEAEDFGRAADALTDWATTGEVTAQERAFIDNMAAQTLTLTQLSGYGDRSAVQLGYAQFTLALARLAYAPDDPRVALALRERAAAETALAQYTAAEATLQQALPILTAANHGDTFLVVEDLAVNAWLRGDLDQASRLMVQADQARDAAYAAGVDPLAAYDQSTRAVTRARLAIALGDAEGARGHLARARATYAEAAATTTLKANQRDTEVAFATLSAEIAQLDGDLMSSARAALRSVSMARKLMSDRPAERVLLMTNAADTLMVAGEAAQASDILAEAITLGETVLPPDAPPLVAAHQKRAFAALIVGDRPTAIDALRVVTQARKSPTYRDDLSDAALDFETLAWALLEAERSPDSIDEALAALQWTQASGSAEALAMTGARIAAADPLHGVLIKARQDLVLDMTRTQSALSEAYAAGPAALDQRAALVARQRGLTTRLEALDEQMAQAGLQGTGLARIAPLSLSQIQAVLRPGEVLVTFILPSLDPTALAGAGGSTNRVVAITSDGIEVAPVAESSRRALNRRIDTLRCSMAIGEPGCGALGTSGLRGAMLMDEADEDEAPFDWATPHDLYRDLFGGIGATLADADHIIVAAPPDLLRLPFQALVTRAHDGGFGDAPWLIRSHAVSVIPSIPALAQVRQARPTAAAASGRMLGVGDPAIGSAPDLPCEGVQMAALRAGGDLRASVYGGHADGLPLADPARLAQLARLPDATCELRALSQAQGQATLLLRDEATETAIKALDADGTLAGYDTLVFATHGLVAGETSATAPGLVLTPPAMATAEDDGLLTSAEVAALTLDADLVVLSACNTAAGEDKRQEGLSGLARGFFHAGARSLMVTHWAVYSDAAVRVSTGVFAARARAPEAGNAQAMRRAILDILDAPDSTAFHRHPAYWAPFAIVGA